MCIRDRRGCELKALYDDAVLFRVCDQTFSNGRIGLWTKADAVTYFDDLVLRLLDDPLSNGRPPR